MPSSARLFLLLASFLPVIPLAGQQPQAAPTAPGQTIQVDAASSISAVNARRFQQTHLWTRAGGVEAHEMYDMPYSVPGLFAAGQSVGYGELHRCVQNTSSPKAVGGQFCNVIINIGDQTGMSLGNAGGWMSTGLLHLTNFTSYAGISQALQIQHHHSGVGDSSMIYGYPFCAGGTTAASDEGCAHWSSVGGQYSEYFSGRFPANTITGQTTFADFDQKSGTCYNNSGQGDRYCYGQGEYLVDSSAPIARGSIASAQPEAKDNMPALMRVEPADLVPVDTWGYIPATVEIPRAQTQNLPKPTADLPVNIARGHGFTAGDAVCFMGSSFPENSTVLSATALVDGHQTITLSLRKPQSKGTPHFLYKAPACGQLSPTAEEEQTGWPAGYFAVPVDEGHLAWAFYSRGTRTGISPPFNVRGGTSESPFVVPVQNRAVNLERAPDGTVTMTERGGGLPIGSFAHLKQVSVSGCQDASFNEVIQLPEPSADLSSLTYKSVSSRKGSCNTAVVNITGANGYVLYYGAEIVATSNPDAPGYGVNGYMQVEQNRIPWQPGHLAKVGHSESYNGAVLHIDQTQLTPSNGLNHSGAILRANLHGVDSGCALCVDNFVPADHYEGLGGWQMMPSYLFWKGPLGTMAELIYAPKTVIAAGHSINYPKGSPNEPDYRLFSLSGYQADGTVIASPSAFKSLTAPSWSFSGAARFQGAVISGTGFSVRAEKGGSWALQTDAQGRNLVLKDEVHGNAVMSVDSGGSVTFAQPVTAPNLKGALRGTTQGIGGASLAAGSCASGIVKVSGATPGDPVAVSASDGSLPPPTVLLSAAVVAADTVKVQICAIAPVTPQAKAYNVRVIP